MAAPARSTASPGHFLDQPARHRFAQQIQPARPRLPRSDSGPRVAGRICNKLPLIRTLLAFNAYSEGWALYAEQLVDELGVYDDFPVGRLGYLQSIAFRACRLVVDTGLHAKRWTRSRPWIGSSTQWLEPARSRERSRPLLCVAGPGVRLQGRAFDDQPPARQGQSGLGTKFDLRSTTRSCSAAMCRWTCWRYIDDYIARTKATKAAPRDRARRSAAVPQPRTIAQPVSSGDQRAAINRSTRASRPAPSATQLIGLSAM